MGGSVAGLAVGIIRVGWSLAAGLARMCSIRIGWPIQPILYYLYADWPDKAGPCSPPHNGST